MIEEKIARRAQRFDLCALLKVLAENGYGQEDVYFCSSMNWASAKGLIESVRFGEGFPRVRVELNMGLLGPNTPLPSHFRKKMDDGDIDAELFVRFVGFFDHHLIKHFLAMSLPEQGGINFDWDEIKGHYMSLLALQSVSTVWFLFQTCFPELIVQVDKNPKTLRIEGSTTTLGRTTLGGDAKLGQSLKKRIPSYKVHLISEDRLTDELMSWPEEVKWRLYGEVLPVLKTTDIHLSIILVLQNCNDEVYMDKTSLLGYSTVGKSDEDLHIRIYSGYPRSKYEFS